MSKIVFVSPYNDGWKVKTVGTQKAAGIFDNKAEAVAKAIEVAKNKQAELRVQKLDGTISSCNSYGNDPRNIKG